MNTPFDAVHRCCTNVELLVSPQLMEFWDRKAKSYGPAMAGALFGGGWAFFLDSVSVSQQHLPFTKVRVLLEVLIFLSDPMLLDELLESYDTYDEGAFCRARSWLFVSYCVSFGAIIAAVWILIHDFASLQDGMSNWPGVAGLFQVALILASALLFFVSRTSADDSGYGYGEF